ncbi:putative p21-activated kinase 3, partial [Trypanosoma grayi]|uniref:putative p21-activated kinase 3 n=1 Tax=Trypanosoma grayi TaxID=71804 RepID=UPI0004F47D31
MPALNCRDRAICQEFIQSSFTLSHVTPYNEPEYSGWISRRRCVADVLVWEFNWFVTSGNYLLRFPHKSECCHPIEIVYLPESGIRRCHTKEECCTGHPFVMEIVTHTHFIREEGEAVAVEPQAVYLSFDSAEDLCGCIAFLAKIATRHVRTAAITFGPPLKIDHRIHLNVKNSENNFGLALLPDMMRSWLLQQGLTAAEVVGNEEAVLGCAKTLYYYQRRQGVAANLPPVPEAGMGRGNRYESDENACGQCVVLSPEIESMKLEPLLSEGDPQLLYSHWERLDGGSQGEVFKAVRNSDGVTVAIKRVRVRRERKDLPALVKEVALLRALRHPNIVTLHDCFRKEKDIFLVMELMDGGKLADLLDPCDGPAVGFTESQLATLMREVLLALKCIHSARCIHRDVKSDNVLLSSRGEVKLGDFGFATRVSAPKGTRQTVVGTPYWMAPEVASGKVYNNKADVWSAGILFIELCDGQPPLMGVNPMRALLKVSTGPPPMIRTFKRWSSMCNNFASFLLVKDPAKRPSVDAAL